MESSSPKHYCESLPDAVFAKVLLLLPAVEIARSCALVCRQWRDATQDVSLWSELCGGTGLRSLDALRCMGGWKGLFGTVYGVNLVASPHFSRIHHMEAEQMKGQALRPWEPKHRLIYDRICNVEEDHDEPHSFSHWATEGGSVFQRGGGDGVLREDPPQGCDPCPAALDKPVLATSYEWGRVQQYIGLQTFSNKFLDNSPPMMYSIWFAGRQGAPSLLRVQVLLRDELKNVIHSWYVLSCCSSPSPGPFERVDFSLC
jgi:F-box protein 2